MLSHIFPLNNLESVESVILNVLLIQSHLPQLEAGSQKIPPASGRLHTFKRSQQHHLNSMGRFIGIYIRRLCGADCAPVMGLLGENTVLCLLPVSVIKLTTDAVCGDDLDYAGVQSALTFLTNV